MRQYETQIVIRQQEDGTVISRTTVTHLVKRTCCLCGKPGLHQWEKGAFKKSSTEITCEEGEIFPECGRFIRRQIDICPECFNNKLIPWVLDQGGEVHEDEVDV